MSQPSSQPSLFDGVPVKAKTPHPVAVERKRLNAAARRVLARLQEGVASNVELCRPECGGMRAVGRIHELRQDGWLIEKSHAHGGLWIYRLIGRKSFA